MSDAKEQFYVRFENRFRGDRDVIKERLRTYLKILDVVGHGRGTPEAVDLGCGRGEWLELLGECGWHVRGFDMNLAMVQECQARGLDAIEGDAIQALRAMPRESLKVVTGFHIVEHLETDALISLTREIFRVLIPGGLCIFETPNPENMQVGSHTFYLDPTHVRPIPPLFLSFLAEESGFACAEVLRVNPHPDLQQALSFPEPALRTLWAFTHGAQDYAVIAIKASRDSALGQAVRSIVMDHEAGLHVSSAEVEDQRGQRMSGLDSRVAALEAQLAHQSESLRKAEFALERAAAAVDRAERAHVNAEAALEQAGAAASKATAAVERATESHLQMAAFLNSRTVRALRWIGGWFSGVRH